MKVLTTRDRCHFYNSVYTQITFVPYKSKIGEKNERTTRPNATTTPPRWGNAATATGKTCDI